jgi:cyclopropane fatty-acyl-phospholipid synthase-like methyltransferase
MSRNITSRPAQAQRVDPHKLYQNAVQCPEAEVDFIEQTFEELRQRQPLLLREDFCGTALNCCEWVRRRADHAAWGVDLNAKVLDWGRRHNVKQLSAGAHRRLHLVQTDVMEVKIHPVDVILALNFSYWVFKRRDQLRAYFERVHAGLVADGILFLDAYGGYDAARVLRERTAYKNYTYIWHQAAYNPVTGETTCHIDFTFPDGSRLPRAYTYHWRLWSLPELRELLAEAGFRRSTVYWQQWDEKAQEPSHEFLPTEVGEADAGWIAYLVAEK